nr:hypothetical protein [Tanacetum cinerariifolium]
MMVQQGEGLSTPTKPYHIPSPEAQLPFHTTHSSSTLPPVTTTSIPTFTPSETTLIRQYTRRARIAQSAALPTIADEPESPLRDVTPRVTSPAADEGTQEVKINSLKERVKLLEAKEGVAAERSRDDAPIKGRSLDEGEAAAERTSDYTEEMETVLTSMDAATVLASEAPEVPTGSGSIPTAGPPAAEVPTGSDVVPTAGLIFATTIVVTPYRRRKGKEVMVESDTPKKQKVQKQTDAHVTRELEEQLERIKEGWKVKDFRGITFEEVEAKFNSVWKRMEDLIPMGLKDEAKRIKRKGLSLEQESAKKQKTSEEVIEEAKSFDEVPKEKVKEMMQLVPI